MKMDNFVPVSVDDHLVEAPDMFEGHAPDNYKDEVRSSVRLKRPGTETVTVLDLASKLPSST